MTIPEALGLLVTILVGAFLVLFFVYRLVVCCTYAYYVGKLRFRRDYRRTNGKSGKG